jgi:arabinogalactan oligomer / maltooligosaccharide transport system substrate-binding protein
MKNFFLRISNFLRFKNLTNLLSFFIISVLFIFLIQGCRLQQPNNNPQQLQGKMLVWHSLQGEVGKVFNIAFEAFKQLNPQVNIISRYIPDNENPSRFIEESQSGFGASAIAIVSKNIGNLVKKGLISPIEPESIDLSRYIPSTLNQVRYDNKIYGIPLGSNTRTLCYNKAKLKINNDPILSNPPTYLDGLIERSQKGYSVGMVSSFEDTFWGMGAFEGSLFDEEGLLQPRLEGWVKWIDWLKSASAETNFIMSRERSILHNAFAQGKLTYYVCNSKEIVDLAQTLKDDLKIALLPQGKEGKSTPLLYTTVMVFNHSNSPNEQNLALAFSKYMTNPQQQIQGIVLTQSFIPTNRYVTINSNLLPIESILLKQAQSSVAISPKNLERLSNFFEQGESIYQQAFAGEISSTDAAQQLLELIDN